MPKLTKAVVDKAEPRDRQYTVWCNDLKGFGVFVLPSGTRTYFVDYRNANNVRRRMKLGRHGAVTAEQARTLAIQALAEVAKGNDPLEDRNSARKAIGAILSHTHYALDRDSRKAALARFLSPRSDSSKQVAELERLY